MTTSISLLIRIASERARQVGATLARQTSISTPE